jgi:glycolate oxidase subunit GlcD
VIASGSSLERELGQLVGTTGVLTGTLARPYLADATENAGITGHADAIVLPRTVEEVAAVVAWCYRREIPITPRGGGTGLAGGCVPSGGVVIAMERMSAIASVDALAWRMHVGAGVTTRRVQVAARQNGLSFPPDPGAAEQSHIGGNAATNAGGPRAFKYGSVAGWVTGVEAVVAPGETIRIGGPVRKDVAGYDLIRLLCGSEGTLGIITKLWLRLIPDVESRLLVAAWFDGLEAGADAVVAVLASGAAPAAIEFFDGDCLAITSGAFPATVPADAQMMLLVETDGTLDEATSARRAVVEAVEEAAIAVDVIDADRAGATRRWREGVSGTVAGSRGGKYSEDIAVPVEHLAAAIAGTREIGRRHRLPSCSWGHAGDGNVHATVMLNPSSPAELERSREAADDLFTLAGGLDGSITGEHGLGLVKTGQLAKQWEPPSRRLHASIKTAFDPRGLFNPGKKLADPPCQT